MIFESFLDFLYYNIFFKKMCELIWKIGCRRSGDNIWKQRQESITFLPLFIILFGIKTVSKIRLKCREHLIYKAFSTCVYYSHSLKLALYGVNLGLFARFIGEFDRLFPLYLWCLRKNGIKMVSMIPPGKHGFPTVSIIP